MTQAHSRVTTRPEAKAQGLKTYFSGNPCAQGHISPRWVAGRKCVACGRQYSNAWKAANRDRSLEITRLWKAANPKSGLDWHRSNREKSQKAWRAYYQSKREWHCERVKPSANKRRAQKRGSEGSHTAADASAILKAQSHRCVYCQADLRNVKRHLDHIMPLALGGSNGPENLQYLCAFCNLSKGAKHPTDFANERGLLL